MSVADNFKKWFLVEKPEEPEEEDIDPVDNVDEPNPREEEQERHRRYKSDNETVKESSYKNMEEREARNQYQSQTRSEEANKNNTTNNNGSSHVINANVMIQVVLVRPEVFTDAKQIADHLLKGKTVVLNLETANAENRRRIIDFIAGVTYAKSGSIKKVAKCTYIVTPQNVGFVGDNIVKELESIEGNNN